MAMFTNKIFIILVLHYYSSLADNDIKIGAFLNYDLYAEASEATNWKAIQENLPGSFTYHTPDVEIVPDDESFETSKLFCQYASISPGYLFVFGPRRRINSETIESICSNFRIPYFITNWIPFKPKSVQNQDVIESTFSLFPETNLFIQGLSKIIQSLHWNQFVIIYEEEDNLIKLQDVLKLQQYKDGSDKNDMLIKQLGTTDDYRPLLKEVKESHITRIVLDCNPSKIIPILQQAKEVKLLHDISTSIFLSSLDAHTVDLSNINLGTNITTVRLFNPYNEGFQRIANQYYPAIPPDKIKVETALRHDSMILFLEVINSLSSKNIIPQSTPINCTNLSSNIDDNHRIALINEMTNTTITNGLTGDEIHLEFNGKREVFHLELIEIDRPDRPIALWNSEVPDVVQFTRNATEREAELQRRLSSHNFIVSSKIGKPYLMIDDENARGNARYKGYSMDLITEIAKIMNISFEFVLTANNLHKNIVEDLINRRADLGVCDFTITPQRSEVIDFSMPFMSLGISILHKESNDEETTNMYAFMDPLSWRVWIYIVTLYLVLSLALLLIARLDPDDWENPHPCNQQPEELENIWGFRNCLWVTLGSIMTQGCDILPKGISSRIATAMWWFFSLILTSSYTANMTAFLTKQKSGDTINNVEELAKQNKVKYGFMKGGSTQDFFKFSNNSLYQKMWAVMKNDPSVFEDTNDRGVDRVLSTKNALYAFFMESTQIEYESERKCDLKKIGQYLDSKSYGIGMPFGAEYRHSINAAVLRLQENGKLSELKTRWWKQNLDGIPPCPSSSDESANQDELTLSHVGGVFVVLAAGIGLAFLIAIIEFLLNVRNISIEEHMTYFEALKVELKFSSNIWITKKRVKPATSSSNSSSVKLDDTQSMARTILAGAGSVLNINASVLNRMAGYTR